MSIASRLGLAVLLAVAMTLTTSERTPADSFTGSEDEPRWIWPVDGSKAVVQPFRAPAHAFGAGHRGIDLTAPTGAVVHAPADGIVAFRGVVVDRALLTIAHADGLVTTFEPLQSELEPGEAVSAGDEIGVAATGGHAAAGTLHVGVRLDGEYINPMLLFGDVSRAVLLPCCEPL